MGAGSSVLLGRDGSGDAQVLDDDWSVRAAQGVKAEGRDGGGALQRADFAQLAQVPQGTVLHAQEELPGGGSQRGAALPVGQLQAVGHRRPIAGPDHQETPCWRGAEQQPRAGGVARTGTTFVQVQAVVLGGGTLFLPGVERLLLANQQQGIG